MDNNRSIFKFGNNMIVHAKGPNMVKNMSIPSGFRTNLMSSTMNMPRNFEEHSYTEPTRSLYYGRDTSPTASIHSDFQPRNFHQPFYQGYSQRSTYAGRQGSPVSMRSIASSSSVDIINQIRNGNFSDNEWRIIHSELEKKTNGRFSRMAARKRKLESRRKRSDNDLGPQGSNSSISSDDSTRTGYSRYNKKYKENVPRSISDFRSTDRLSRNNNINDMYRYYADSNTQNPYRRDADSYYIKNMASSQIKSNNMLFSQKNTLSAPRNASYASSVCSTKSLQNQTVTFQRDRFQNGFQLPYQRFNDSIWPFQIHEKSRPVQNIKCGNNNQSKLWACLDEDSDEDDNIFPDKAVRSQQEPKNANFSGRKRKIDTLGSMPVSASKKQKNYNKNETMNLIQTKNDTKNGDFVFAKPVFPVRKSAPAKTRETLISKSAGTFADAVFNEQDKTNRSSTSQPVDPPSQEKEAELELSDITQLTTSDMSMRPSFMKRKLFTQTLDVTERKNNSCENIATDSPQSNIYSEKSREKHKTRKLVTSQSLLSRDVNQDDNNLLDLIHKIVPPSQVNITKQSKVSVDKTAADDRWDVNSIISTRNNDSVSDTYTDDEIFIVANDVKRNKSREQPSKANPNKILDNKKQRVKPETIKAKNAVIKKCEVVVEKMQTIPMIPEVAAEPSPVKKSVLSKSRIHAFWDTDVESDFECGTPIKHIKKVMQGTPQVSTAKQNGITSYNDVKCTPSATKQTKHTTIDNSKDLIVRKNDPTLVKTLKKQTNKQLIRKTNTKVVNNAKDQNPKPEKPHKVRKASPVTVIKTRRQLSLSLLEAVEKSTPVKKATLASNKKKSSNNKTTEKKMEKLQPSSDLTNTKTHRNKKQNNSVLTAKTTKREEKNKTILLPKFTDTPEDDATLCKILRSRRIDLSSSFNSDQFDLTGISRVRKCRTPIKVTSKR